MTGSSGNRRFRVPFAELRFEFVRSSGPGGQNVNKVNSKAVLRWSVGETTALDESGRSRVSEKLHRRITSEGELVLSSDRHRDQKKNRDDCVEKLVVLVEEALSVPKPRRETKPTRASRRRQAESKSRDSEKKRNRGKIRV